MTKIVYEGAQAALREEPGPMGPKNCQWCGEPATRERTIVPERRDAEKNLVKPGTMAWVCDTHSAMIDRNEEIAHLKRKRRIQVKRIGHPKFEKDQEVVRQSIADIDAKLSDLGERVEPIAA